MKPSDGRPDSGTRRARELIKQLNRDLARFRKLMARADAAFANERPGADRGEDPEDGSSGRQSES